MTNKANYSNKPRTVRNENYHGINSWVPRVKRLIEQPPQELWRRHPQIYMKPMYLPSKSVEHGVLRKLKHIFPNTYQRIKSICSPAKGGTGCYRFNYQPGS